MLLDVAIAVGIVICFALAGCKFVNDLERDLERQFPSRARAWEQLGRRDEKDAA